MRIVSSFTSNSRYNINGYLKLRSFYLLELVLYWKVFLKHQASQAWKTAGNWNLDVCNIRYYEKSENLGLQKKNKRKRFITSLFLMHFCLIFISHMHTQSAHVFCILDNLSFKKSFFSLFSFQITIYLLVTPRLNEAEARTFDYCFISIVCWEHGKTANSGILKGWVFCNWCDITMCL